MSEMLLSFLVIFATFTLGVYYYQYYKQPMGFAYDNVWQVNYNNSYKTDSGDSLTMFYERLRETLNAMPSIRGVSFASDNTPFSQNTMMNEVDYNKKNVSSVNTYATDDAYPDVLHIKILEGHWYNKADAIGKESPIVINTSLKEKLFGQEPAVGKIVSNNEGKHLMKVIGVVEDVKFKGDYAQGGMGFYNRIDTGRFRSIGRILIQATPNADAAFEGRLYKVLANTMKNSNVEIEHLDRKRVNINYFALVPMIVLSVVAGFLVINVALGLFGVLWYNINKRRGEIGLRRAVGATGRSVSMQLVGEAVFLATLSMIVGTFFAIQFPLLHVFDLAANTYLIALGLAILFIYVLVIICSLYPGRQAAAIYPAVALHEE